MINFPISWSDKIIAIKDKVLFLPENSSNGLEFVFPGWQHPEVFGNQQPVNVEYCSGNGAWIVAKAIENPHVNWVAIERKYIRAKKTWMRMKRSGINNLFVICGEGLHVTRQYFPKRSVNEVFINFPDPWPKRRHAQNRIIQPVFVQEIHHLLRDEAAINLVTDDPVFSLEMIRVMKQNLGFVSAYEEPHFITEYEGYGSSFFEELWREKGKTIRYHRFQKRPI